MSAGALPSLLMSDSVASNSFAAFVRSLFSAIDEGLELAERYRKLAHKTDAELASLGLKRQDVMQVVYFGGAA